MLVTPDQPFSEILNQERRNSGDREKLKEVKRNYMERLPRRKRDALLIHLLRNYSQPELKFQKNHSLYPMQCKAASVLTLANKVFLKE